MTWRNRTGATAARTVASVYWTPIQPSEPHSLSLNITFKIRINCKDPLFKWPVNPNHNYANYSVLIDVDVVPFREYSVCSAEILRCSKIMMPNENVHGGTNH